MEQELGRLLTDYDDGRLTRRQLLGALALVASAQPGAADAAPVGAVKSMNHVTIFVPDVKKSVAFYQDLVAMPTCASVSATSVPLQVLDAGVNLLR